MTDSPDRDRWLALGEALRIYAGTIGVSEGLLRGVAPEVPGIRWFSDQPLMVYEIANGLAVDRGEFDAMLQRIIARMNAAPPTWSKTSADAGEWIGLEEAFGTYGRRLGLPESFRQEMIEELGRSGPGMVWLSDQAITLYAGASGLGFDRKEFDALVEKMGPTDRHDRT